MITENDKAAGPLQLEMDKIRAENEELKLMYDAVVKHATFLENDLERKIREITFLSNMDSMTGIFNRRKFNETIIIEADRARKEWLDLSIIFYDVDNFKHINDHYGHNTGDNVLKEATDIIRESLGEEAVFARWGGDEFAILLPRTALTTAVNIAETVRRSIADHVFPIGEQVSCSFGVTSFRRNEELRAFLVRADDALYEAKKNGKNSVKFF